VDEEKSERSFRVEDRRRFTATGEPRDKAPEEGEGARETKPPEGRAGASEECQGPLPELTFSTFVLSLSTQALVLLGEAPDPTGKGVQPDLEAARQLIDILGILQAKTKGNLDSTESHLLDNVLYDLRMRFVERARCKS